MSVRRKRIEVELESNFVASQGSRSGSARSGNQSVVQSVGAVSRVDSEMRTRAWVDASLVDSSLSPRHVPSPCISRSSLHPSAHPPTPPPAVSDLDDAHFTPVVSKKDARRTSSTKPKTAPIAKTTPVVKKTPIPKTTTAAKTAPKGAPRTGARVAAPKATPNPKTAAPNASKKLPGKTTQIVVSPSPSYTAPFEESTPVDVVPELTPVGETPESALRLPVRGESEAKKSFRWYLEGNRLRPLFERVRKRSFYARFIS